LRVLPKRFSVLRGHHQELGVVEPFWEAQLAILVTVVLYVALPSRPTVGPGWLPAALVDQDAPSVDRPSASR
jgi:hypothetical protein